MAGTPEFEAVSLQVLCKIYIVSHLENYPTDLLSLLPRRERKELFMCLPPLDIYRLENTALARDVDMNEVWNAVSKLYFNSFWKSFHIPSISEEDEAQVSYYEMIKNDWRMYFIIQIVSMLMHALDPSKLPTHWKSLITDEVVCPAWNHAINFSYSQLLKFLLAVEAYKESNQRSNFKIVDMKKNHSFMLIPLRHCHFLADDPQIMVWKVFKTLITECCIRPKVLLIHCEFACYSQLYQLFCAREETLALSSAWSLLVQLLSELERVEFCWSGKYNSNSSEESTPTLFLEAILDHPAPKLSILCLRVHDTTNTIFDIAFDDFLSKIAPFFSAGYHTEGTKSTITPYFGLKKLHLFGIMYEEFCTDTISSIIHYQSSLECLEIICSSSFFGPKNLLDKIQDVFLQPQLQYLAWYDWHDKDFKDAFHPFLEANCNFEICVLAPGYEIVIPIICSQDSNSVPIGQKILKYDLLWKEEAWLLSTEVQLPLRSVKIKESFCSDTPLDHVFSSCPQIDLDCNILKKHSHSKSLASNPNLQSLKFQNTYKIADTFLDILSAIFACSPHLSELCLYHFKSDDFACEEMIKFFECLVSCPYPKQLSVDLCSNELKVTEVNELLKVWKRLGEGRKLKSIKFDSEDLQMIADEITQVNSIG